MMDRFEQLYDKTWTTLNPDLKIKNQEKLFEEMTAWAVSGPVALERIDLEEAWEEEAASRTVAHKEKHRLQEPRNTIFDRWLGRR